MACTDFKTKRSANYVLFFTNINSAFSWLSEGCSVYLSLQSFDIRNRTYMFKQRSLLDDISTKVTVLLWLTLIWWSKFIFSKQSYLICLFPKPCEPHWQRNLGLLTLLVVFAIKDSVILLNIFSDQISLYDTAQFWGESNC